MSRCRYVSSIIYMIYRICIYNIHIYKHISADAAIQLIVILINILSFHHILCVYLNCVLCITISMCFLSNGNIKTINQYLYISNDSQMCIYQCSHSTVQRSHLFLSFPELKMPRINGLWQLVTWLLEHLKLGYLHSIHCDILPRNSLRAFIHHLP